MLGQTLNNRYLVTTRLGKGAMGTVYRATDTQDRREVALKIISSELAVDPEMLERFKREGDALRKLKHPNIVGYLEAFHIDEQYVIVMEYIPGGSLHELLKTGPMPIDRVRQIALDVCDALIRAHRLNIIHRDIKPENILIDEDGTPKLADFGVARLGEGTRMTRSGTQVGTPYYMSPEAWKGELLDAQADIWSLGVVLYEMLSGRVPFDGDTGPAVMTKVFNSSPPELTRLRKEIPSGLVKIIERMLTREKEKRYQTMREVAVDMERGQGSGKTKFRLSLGFAGLIFILGLTGIVLAAWLNNKREDIPPTSTIVVTDEFVNETPLPSESILPSDTIELDAPPTEYTDSTGAPMALVPGGEFRMGSETGDDDELPVHQVVLDSFYMDKYEVTNLLYQACIEAGACEPPHEPGSATQPDYFRNPAYENHPVINVDWHQASEFCEWRGARLPTEAEWEKSARGEDVRKYPWGESINAALANYFNGVGDTSEAGSYQDGRSGYGIYDLAGNVWEWVSDSYDERYYSTLPSSADNPTGPVSGETGVIRGGSWNDSAAALRASNRAGLNRTAFGNDLGFRCSRDASDVSAETPVANEFQWSGIIAVRLPTLNEIREEMPSIWDANGLSVNDMLTPGIQSFTGFADSGREYLWPVYWCAIDRATLDQNLESISTTFRVDGEIVPEEFVFSYYLDTDTGWVCNYHAIVIGNLPENTSLNLQAVRILEADILDGQSSYARGTYTYELIVQVR